jgi:hypothetical protein
MRASKGGDLPKDLLRGRTRFQAWRQQRKTRGRIPDRLWALAVRLVNSHGLNRTVRALGVDYYSLKRRVEAAASGASSAGPAFVELPAPAAIGKQCLFELTNPAGATLRVQLLGCDTADVEALARAVWSAE